LGLPWDGRVDIWSIGCLLSELILGAPIFYEQTVESVLAAQTAICGPMPPHMLKWTPSAASMYFTSSEIAFQVDPPNMPVGCYHLVPLAKVSLADLFIQYINEPTFVRFVSAMLTLDSTQRPTAMQLLGHEWLQHAALARCR